MKATIKTTKTAIKVKSSITVNKRERRRSVYTKFINYEDQMFLRLSAERIRISVDNMF
jgi:hypothetical protein